MAAHMVGSTMHDQPAEPPSSDIPQANISRFKNKQKRAEMYRKMKAQLKKQKLKDKSRKKMERKALGDKAPPKKAPKTIENMRVYDETMVDPQDEEVAHDEEHDEMASYFNRETQPKVLITASDVTRFKCKLFCRQLQTCIPNSEVFARRRSALKKVIPQAIERGFTDLIVINGEKKLPDAMLICHLPDGPTAHFKLTNVKLRKEIKKCGETTDHLPELILNNFNTRLGHSVGRLIASLFPHDPDFVGRRAVTFHNQRDYIFFRHHRYIFRNAKKVGLQELGPRFTLKLRSLQKGTFDTKFGEYEWVHKRHEMETSRRKFFL
ncbi:ribosome production factor 1-like [Patiria miniata]|uniref:Brix domain-containing protein n=1 Tax=Patiria miniata TaxID=46514 RepID=A0A914AWA4_PATMI|nr:ribosome production factor 1-like [Patiria miniata]XP_038067984.1 ribosome production factor 1-like [Patiria miniata]